MEHIVIKTEPVYDSDIPSTSTDQETTSTAGIAIKQGIKEELDCTYQEDYVDEAELVEIKFEAKDKTFLDQGYKINNNDKESGKIKEEERDSDFSEEGTFETKIEVKYHGVECDDVSGKKKLFQCDVCPKKYQTKMGLFNHKKYFHGKDELEEFKCDKCDYVTVRKSTIKIHLKIHDKQSYFKCDYCQYKAAKLLTLHAHILSKHKLENEGEKKIKITSKIHECPKCSYSTLHKAHYDNHIKICLKLKNAESYKCFFCQYKSNHKTNLDNHTLTKHSDMLNESNRNIITSKIHHCQLCEYRTAKVDHLKSHLKNKHKKKQ
ncbi:unnamed protein product [Brassicogethes aeneus]|uniref:C2H2-type domain-containing protein n=1 Tax=Brassicogethes aeneus TaxID=1431903 RepID=A0A9P0ASB4_BRAAE|nr:unnamed protein product [Brassicogethes aeneus]